MPRATPLPQAPPTRYTYELTRGTERKVMDLYSPVEIWRRHEHLGAWTDTNGNTLRLATMTTLLPRGFPMPHVESDTIDEALKDRRNRPNDWSLEHIRSWMQDFSGDSTLAVEVVTRPPHRLSQLIEARPTRAASTVAFAFKLNRHYAGFSSAADTVYAVFLDVGNPGYLADARAALLEQFLESVSPLRANRGTQSNQLGSRMQDRRYADAGRSNDEIEESRQQAAASIRNLKDWWFVNTDHYVFLSNLDSSNRGLVRELQTDIEAIRMAFEKILPPRLDVTAASVVRVFASPAEYEDYVPPAQRWTSGLWIPAKGELVIRPRTDGREREQREHVLRAVYHEAFHQYLHYAFDRLTASAWFNEGHASFFESANVDYGRRLSVQEDRHKADVLEQLARKNGLDIRPLLAMDYPAFYGTTDQHRDLTYSLAWGLVYYLRMAAPNERSGLYADVLDRYADTLWTSRDPDHATAAAFAGVDLDAFNRDLNEFWTSSRKRRTAERHSILPGVLR